MNKFHIGDIIEYNNPNFNSYYLKAIVLKVYNDKIIIEFIKAGERTKEELKNKIITRGMGFYCDSKVIKKINNIENFKILYG